MNRNQLIITLSLLAYTIVYKKSPKYHYMKTTLLSILLGSCTLTMLHAQENYVSKVWVADQGNGTYKNPVLYADYSDPDVIRVGEDYYLTSSSIGCLPGLQILHSKDLVNWHIAGVAIPHSIPPVTDIAPQHGNRTDALADRMQESQRRRNRDRKCQCAFERKRNLSVR